MPDLTDAQLDQLIADLGLKPPRELKPCGTPAAYRRHIKRGEEPCEPCRAANTQRKKAGAVTGRTGRRKPIAHGTRAGYRQHRYRGEEACPACMEAERLRLPAA